MKKVVNLSKGEYLVSGKKPQALKYLKRLQSKSDDIIFTPPQPASGKESTRIVNKSLIFKSSPRPSHAPSKKKGCLGSIHRSSKSRGCITRRHGG